MFLHVVLGKTSEGLSDTQPCTVPSKVFPQVTILIKDFLIQAHMLIDMMNKEQVLAYP